MTTDCAQSAPRVLPIALLIDQHIRWRRGKGLAVEAYLELYPELRDQPGTILDLIYHEIVLREQRGEEVWIDEYLTRFPAFSAEIVDQFSVHEAWADLVDAS